MICTCLHLYVQHEKRCRTGMYRQKKALENLRGPAPDKCIQIAPDFIQIGSLSAESSAWTPSNHTTTTVLWPFFRDQPGEPMPEENFWTLWCKGRLTEADTLTIRLGATPSGLTSAHLHHPPIKMGRKVFQYSAKPSFEPKNESFVTCYKHICQIVVQSSCYNKCNVATISTALRTQNQL